MKNNNTNQVNTLFSTASAIGPATPINLTEATLTDELTYQISSHNVCHIEEDEEGNQCIRIYHLYLEQAEHALYWCNAYDPAPEFTIFTGDISGWLMDALAGIDKITMKRIVTNAVRRIYESVDPEYFHTNGIYGKIRWRFVSQ